MNVQAQVLAKCQEVIQKAKVLYNLDLSVVSIQFNLKGRVAGWAARKNGKYHVRFNWDMIARGGESLKDMLEDTVPHELAHIVCFMNPALGRDHNYGWANVCRQLGGNGARYHSTPVVYGKGTTYEYTTDRGHAVRVNDRRHAYIQAGGTLTYRKGLGQVTKMCAYSIVGAQGRTLAAPVVRQAPNHPALVEAFVKQQAVVAKAPAVQQGLSAVAQARAIMLSAHKAGRAYADIIRAVVFATQVDQETAEDIYFANHEKLGLPEAP